MRTYAGHSSPAESNALYRRNLAKGQTGLSVAFDLPTQTGYDPDSPMAAGEVGKVGVPIAHLGDMRRLFDGIPLGTMNTSMTINATAMWLYALYVVAAEEQGVAAEKLSGTIQNDILKEFMVRNTYIYPPKHSMRGGCNTDRAIANSTKPKQNLKTNTTHPKSILKNSNTPAKQKGRCKTDNNAKGTRVAFASNTKHCSSANSTGKRCTNTTKMCN